MGKGIAVLDFGGQYAHLIANRIRRHHVFSAIHPPQVEAEELSDVEGIILSGGPASVYGEGSPTCDPGLLDLGIPVLGICYGHQLLARLLGGQVRPGDVMEFGAARLQVLKPTGVLRGLEPEEPVWMSHRDSVIEPPPGFACLAATPACPVAAMGDERRRIYGLQFHPEVTHTTRGMQILGNFVELCGCERTWTMDNYMRAAMEEIVARTAGRKVFLLVSGGVDSTVSFLLLNRALGEERVMGIHIDNGFMRRGETRLVHSLMTESGFRNLRVVDASEAFLRRVEGVVDPEEKRRLIGAEFVAVRDRVLAELRLDPDEWLLGQGTLYTDTIESGGTHHADVIKTHHNRVDVIARLLAEGKVIEPLAQLYKDEVRELGERLGLPAHLVWRHPFPGPGLAVRALCSSGKPDASDPAQGADGAADSSSAHGEALESTVREAASVAARFGFQLTVLPLRSVGVQGDSRTYAHPAVISGPLDWDRLERVSTEITNVFDAINRVVYLLAPARLPALRLHPAYLTRSRLDVLRSADAVVMEALEEFSLMREVTQMPTVLLPLTSSGKGEVVVLRPVSTEDFMTARFCRLSRPFLDAVRERLMALDGVDAVLYDITHKPPATVEWE